MPHHFEIPLTQGQVALVDSEDYEWLSQWKWCALWDSGTRSFRAIRGVRINGKSRTIFMHREIMRLAHGDPRKVDHIEPGKTLDNRRSNLRVATHAQNAKNRRPQKNTSGFKGVSKRGDGVGWQARIRVDGKLIYLGSRLNPESAHRELYVPAALKYHREFARVN